MPVNWNSSLADYLKTHVYYGTFSPCRLNNVPAVHVHRVSKKLCRIQHLGCSVGESLALQNSWRRWTQNTSDRWVSAVWPVDRWCRYQPVASSSNRFCPCLWGTLTYATADEADAYMFYRCFFFAFYLFRSPQKYQKTVLGNGWTDFHETFTKR